MIHQVAFSKLTKIFNNYLLVAEYLQTLNSKRGRKLYQELVRIALATKETILLLNYNFLKKKLGYKSGNIRKAILELEKLTVITKIPKPGCNSFYIELNPEFWMNNIK